MKLQKYEEFELTEKQVDEGDEKDYVEFVDPEDEHPNNNVGNYYDTYPKEENEHLFDGEEKNWYKTFCRAQITCPLPTHALEDPSSLFAGEDEEVDLKFDMFLQTV